MDSQAPTYSASLPLRLKYVAKRPNPFPPFGGSSSLSPKSSSSFDQELHSFTNVFREIKEKYARLRGELKKKMKELDDWYDEIDFTSHPGEKASAQSMFRKVRSKAEDIINTMSTHTHYALNPYFGRIDFTFPADAPLRFRNKNRSFYIGKRGLQLSNIKITDWRAPISSIYYNFPEPTKDCFYKSEKGMIMGELTLKRKIDIENASLLQVLDSSEVTSLVGSDPFLMRQLNKGASSRLKDIISTIQSEQNTIISMEPDKDIVVAGVAGSGKTSIAIHRLSWLLYNHRDILPHRCLIVGPSKLFLHYIADILPETGSENVPQTTVEDWAIGKLKGLVNRSELDQTFKIVKEKSQVPFMKKMEALAKAIRPTTETRVEPATVVHKYLTFTKQKIVTLQDLPPLVYLKSLVFDILPSEKIQYAVLDEVQDRTPAEIFALKHYTEKGRFLAVGDLLQGIANPLGIGSWDVLFDGILKEKETEQFSIRTSYRSTKEIIDYVNGILLNNGIAGHFLPRPVLRNGPKPTIFDDVSLDEALELIPQFIHDEVAMGRKNVAVIVPQNHLTLFSDELTKHIPQMTTISRNDQLYDGGPLVSYIKLLKGLEFDSVIFVNADEGDAHDLSMKKLYTSCTRAMHKLYGLKIKSY